MLKKDKFYDISKATPLVTVRKTFGKKYGENPDDDWTETLYKKNNGEFFVYGEGGKNTPYSVDKDGTVTSGSRYEVWLEYNYNNARNWVHTNCPERQEEIFTVDTEKKSVTTIMLSEKARLNLKRKAREQGVSISELIRQWAESMY